MWSSVNENIVDGTSGLDPSGDPIAILVGTSSLGTVNKAITIGTISDVSKILGYGSLPNILKDMQLNMADVPVLAVRSEADIQGNIRGMVTEGDLEITVTGAPLVKSLITVTVNIEGEIGTAELKIQSEGDIESSELMIIPADGVIDLPNMGISILMPIEASYSSNMKWVFGTSPPASSLEAIKAAVDKTLEIYSPECVVVCQPSSSADVKYYSQCAEEYFTEWHQPLFFVTQTELDATKNLDEAIADKVSEFDKVEARFVSVLCQYGTLINGSKKYIRQPLGLLVGHITKAKVNQSIGATNNFALSNYELPYYWSNVHSRALDGGRFITLRTYAGLNNVFWSNGRTMAGDTSDYRFIEVVRTVQKAIRIARRASLPYIQGAGDEVGLNSMLAEIRTKIATMTESQPKELDDFSVDMPSGQDVVNDGVTFNISLFGIPIIRTINLNFMFKYKEAS